MELSLKLENFEGPLDLLLHLIDKNKINIFDIPITLITEQYLEALKEMQEQKLDVMSEFLIMAATLLDIKARMLLPAPEKEEEEPEDPRAELVQRLLEYRKYKLLSGRLREFEEEGLLDFYRGEELPEEVLTYKAPVDTEALLDSIPEERLKAIFEELMRRQDLREDLVHSHFGEIEREAVQIGDRLDHVKERVRQPGRHSFRSLLSENASKLEVVVTFLAILELIREGTIRLAEGSEGSEGEEIYLEDNAG